MTDLVYLNFSVVVMTVWHCSSDLELSWAVMDGHKTLDGVHSRHLLIVNTPIVRLAVPTLDLGIE